MGMLETVQGVMRGVFLDDALTITPEMSALDVDGWDSLSHTVLMLELEKAFGIEIDIALVAAMPNIGALIDHIAALAPSSGADLLPAEAPPAETSPYISFYTLQIDGRRHILDALYAYRLHTMILEPTSRCNLRCVFCPKANDSHNETYGRDMDMPDDILESTYGFLESLGPLSVALVGVGEPTFRPGWMKMVDRILSMPGKSIAVNSNFGRLLDDEEIATLLRFTFITVSIESADMATQKRLRKAVDLRTIVYNLLRLKIAASIRGVKLPHITFNCTVTDQNVMGVDALAALARELGVTQITFSSLYEYEMDEAPQTQAIEHLDPAALAEARAGFDRAVAVVKGSATEVTIQPALRQSLDGGKTEESIATPGSTRVCLQPWGQYTIGAAGEVYPCCVMTDAFATISQPPEEIANGKAIRDLRRQLLTGNMPEMCKGCSNAPLGTTEQLLTAVANQALRTGRVPIQL